MAGNHEERIYQDLSRRLQPIEKKLDEEGKLELDAILCQFSMDLCAAVTAVTPPENPENL